MTKKFFYSLIALSLIVHLLFICSYPLTADELNIFNIYNFHSPDFTSFWDYFKQYDTHQPLFYVFWYPFFSNEIPSFVLRLPSLIFYMGSLFVWGRIFNFSEKKNLVPWIMFLFCPFLSVYSSFFLPYSLLILCSLINYFFFEKMNSTFNKRDLSFFILSALILIFTHYYGALQVLLLCIYLIYKSKKTKLKVFLAAITLGLVSILLFSTDFINDFGAVHSYRKIPNIMEVLGEINLLLGGIYSSIILLVLLIHHKKWSALKSKEMIFITVVVGIAFLKSALISPSLEARYLLILIYPLYKLFSDTQIKYISLVLITINLVSLYILMNKFSPSFVIDYRDIQKDDKLTAIVITPCPKFYFMEENYRCTGIIDGETLWRSYDAVLIHADHMDVMKNSIPNLQCTEQKKGLYYCTVPPFHF